MGLNVEPVLKCYFELARERRIPRFARDDRLGLYDDSSYKA